MWMYVEGECVLDGNRRMVSVKARFISGCFCPNLDEYDRALNVNRASKANSCEKR